MFKFTKKKTSSLYAKVRVAESLNIVKSNPLIGALLADTTIAIN